jgi:SET domain
MLLTAISIAGSLEQFKRLLSNSSTRTVFDCDLSDPNDADYVKNLLVVVNSMAKSEHSKIVITEGMKSVFNHPPFDALWSTNDERELLIECFHNQLRIHNTNQLEMGEHSLEKTSDRNYWFVKTIGSGLCPFASLFNHSCDANVKRTCVDNKIAFIVAKPIAADEQLFLSYGYSSYRYQRDERQSLLGRFSFTCDCVACVENYPTLENLPRIDNEFIEPDFSSMKFDEAKRIFMKNCSFVEENIEHHPSFESTLTMIHSDHLMHQMSKGYFSQ